jgi:hypothetical protein
MNSDEYRHNRRTQDEKEDMSEGEGTLPEKDEQR